MAIKEQDVVLVAKDTSGNKVIQMPITRVENVEGAIKTINEIAPDASGNVAINTVANATKATQDASGNVITATYATKAELSNKLDSSSAFTKAQADNLYLGKSAKATSASMADTATSATKATQDGTGKVIATTYATKTEVTSGLSGKLDKTAKATSAITADTATSATSAVNATKATQDASGNVITTTYATKSEVNTGLAGKANSSHTHTKSQITDFPEIPDTSTLIPKTGDRGSLRGYETTNTDIKAGTGIIVTADSPDAQYYHVDGLVEGDNVTVENGTAGTSWTKVVYMFNGGIGLDTSWKWVGGKAPTLKHPGILVVHWHHNGGIANYIAGAA